MDTNTTPRTREVLVIHPVSDYTSPFESCNSPVWCRVIDHLLASRIPSGSSNMHCYAPETGIRSASPNSSGGGLGPHLGVPTPGIGGSGGLDLDVDLSICRSEVLNPDPRIQWPCWPLPLWACARLGNHGYPNTCSGARLGPLQLTTGYPSAPSQEVDPRTYSNPWF